ncbi:potassium channel family protein [Acanthopleuribacter pedis]|uniref:NAD-binding protein n=1 Tax=Acanthopleuribacter pedis TaxID=442870 RepID=A0A8J7U3B1_9BACT|nr:potassium channel family protein [Acanthopleuribacter pedis]MBO1320208.1 NAD-binding protein [Acanthopleuribacter pedis]
MKVKTLVERLIKFCIQENLHRVFVVVFVLLFLSGFAISHLEDELSFVDGLWWSIVTLTTVGYGDISPATLGGRVIAVFLMLFGIGVLGTLSATLAGFLIEKRFKEDRGMGTIQFDDHIVLCGWNRRANFIYQELRKDPTTSETPIVIIDELENKPLDDADLYLIRGELDEDTFARANIAGARTAIVMGDDTLPVSARDAAVVLTTLTIESMNPDVYTIVELSDERNVQHCERANANEIIVHSELSSSLIARAALNHGISTVISELLAYDRGNELYKLPIPASMVGKSFNEIFYDLKKNHHSIAVAVQRGDGGKVFSNPDDGFTLESKDFLMLIAPKRPKLA